MRKPLIAAITAVVVAAGVGGPAEAAGHDPIPARQGATWLYGQLDSAHLMHNAQYDFDDYGLTADTGLELATLGRHKQALTIAKALAPQAATKWYRSTYGGVTTTYAGSVAKAAVLAQVAGLDPHSYGGTDLIALLESEVAQDAPIRGRMQDQNDSFGDANVLGQALAARALTDAHSADAGPVRRFLLGQQCAAGYFTLDFNKDKASATQTCTGRGAAPDTDATSYVVIQLQGMGHRSAAVSSAIDKAQAWLKRKQKSSGAWGGGTSTTAANANSTGLATWALGSGAAAHRGAVWLRKHQVRDAAGCHTRLSASRGAVAYDTSTMRAGLKAGITVATRDQWRRTTTQALIGLTLLPRASKDISVAPAKTRVRAGRRVRVHVRHAAPYSMVCVRIGKHRKAASVGVRGRTTVKVKVPAGKRHRAVKVVDSDGREARASLRVTR